MNETGHPGRRMVMLSWLALIFLTLLGYSAGALLGSRMGLRRQGATPSPGILDMTMIVALWVGGILLRVSGTGKWFTVILSLILAAVVAFFLNLARPVQDEGKSLTH